MSAFIVQNGKYVTTVMEGSNIQLFANDAGINNNPEFLVVNGQGTVIKRVRVMANLMANAWYDWKAPKASGYVYTFYQDSADLQSADKHVDFSVSSSGSDGDGNGDGEDGDGGRNPFNLPENVVSYLPWIGLALVVYLVVMMIVLQGKK